MRWSLDGGARRLASGAVALALALAALGGCTSGRHGGGQAAAEPRVAGAPATKQPADVFDQIPAVVKRVEPSVVTILTGGGLGSGVVWSSNGVIVTNQHVVTQGDQVAGNVQVAFADGRRVSGTVKATDSDTDLAVVQADRAGLHPATFQKALPDPGELAIAIGSPLGFQNTVTAGIISGLHREIPGSAAAGSRALVDLVQTDAAISPGNSGGALVNAQGQVIGINEAYIPPQQGAVSLGFAIPAATVVDIVGQLLKTGHARHAFFGVEPTDLTPEIAAQLGTSRDSGVVVLDVQPGAPAAKAGIQPGDLIVALDGKAVNTVEDFLAALRQHQPGDTVSATIVRGNTQQDKRVTLTDRPPSAG
jgi:S1-C subfamily serine protease